MDENHQDKTGSKLIARLRSWWPKIEQHPMMTAAIIVAGLLVTALIVVVVLGYWFNWPWVGVNGGYSKITTTPQGTNIDYSPRKTLWDWLQLLGVLAIPVVVGFGAAWFTSQQGKVSDRENKDNQREAALQKYIDKMSELLLDANRPLRDSKSPDEVRKIARTRTLATISSLDGSRKGSLIQFLFEADLINKDIESAIYLYNADLSGANLNRAILNGVYLGDVNLSGANLSNAILIEASFIGANLSGANLHKADLTSANLGRSKQLIELKHSTIPRNIKNTNLCKADLSEAILSRAILGEADLRGADLRGADLRGAKMNDKTDLRGTKLQAAKYNTKVIQEKDALGKLVTIESTQWPQGFDPKIVGSICVDC
jgi:hypothetical protein